MLPPTLGVAHEGHATDKGLRVAGTRSLAWAGVIVMLALLFLVLSAAPPAGGVESRAAGLLTPLTGGVRDLLRPVSDLVLNAGQLDQLSTQNAALQQEVARLQAEVASLREADIATEQVRALQDSVGAEQSGGVTPATVLLRDPAPGRQALLIGLGSRDGVAVGQPVLGPGATLVGLVESVDGDRARIRLLSDADAAVTAVVQSSRVQGALAGTGTGLVLEMVPVGSAVARGDVLLSSALGGRLPPGLLIGRVATAEEHAADLFATITIEPLTDYTRLERVLVMTGFRPDSALSSAAEEAP